jgi:hypothetical protein
MRPFIPLSLPLILFIGACHSSAHSDNQDTSSEFSTADSVGHPAAAAAAAKNPGTGSEDSILKSLKARFADTTIPFEGMWVNEHYVNEIRQGTPVRKSQDTATRCIVFPKRTLQDMNIIFGFHEGGEELVVVKNGPAYFFYALHDGQCVDTIRSLSDGRLKIGQQNYIRVGEEDSNSADMGVLKHLLFAGEYKRADGAGTVAFKKDGKIEGLDSLGWYDPVIDYADWGYETQLDHIRLGADRQHLHDYGFRFAGKTLELYTIDCLQQAENDCVLDTLGRRMYALQKVE